MTSKNLIAASSDVLSYKSDYRYQALLFSKVLKDLPKNQWPWILMNSESDSFLHVHLKKKKATSNPTDFRQTTHTLKAVGLILIVCLLTDETLQNILLYEK